MGRRCFACDGEGRTEVARLVVRCASTRLHDRESSRVTWLFPDRAPFRLACTLPRRRSSCITRAFYSNQSQRIGSLATDASEALERALDRHTIEPESFRLSRIVSDFDGFLRARYAGHVSDVFENATRFLSAGCSGNDDDR